MFISVVMALFNSLVSILLLDSRYILSTILIISFIPFHWVATIGIMGIYLAKSKCACTLCWIIFFCFESKRSILLTIIMIGNARLFISAKSVMSLCVTHCSPSIIKRTNGLLYSNIHLILSYAIFSMPCILHFFLSHAVSYTLYFLPSKLKSPVI